MVSARVSKIEPSKTVAIDTLAKQLKKEGKDIVNLSAGEPDFPTPDNVKEAAIKAIRENFTKYTAPSGIIELKEAIVNKFKKENNVGYSTENVIVSCGGKHSFYNIVMSLLQKGDEAIIPKPYWVSYSDMVKLSDAAPILCSTDENFRIEADLIKEKITKNTKLIVINSPNNPSGSVIEEKELRKIADIAVEKNIHVLSDEVYEHFIYSGKKHVSIASFNEDIKKMTITLNSLSKTYSMTGWRIGYCAAEKDLAKAVEKMQSQSTGNPTSIAQKAALEALNGPQDFLKERISEFEKRRSLMVKMLNGAGLKCDLPEGAFYCFPGIESTKLNSEQFCQKLLKEHLVAAVPGIAFGTEGHVRFSYAASMPDIKKGMERVKKLIESLS
ncbi:pyridoxal phosphate-dependent aminotransferase [Candidatus Woesearchaeota archaeon]|nr:pyridoxal phosphate-dependent aminotransferase [Candidatus Woesearchaeota archaeon]